MLRLLAILVLAVAAVAVTTWGPISESQSLTTGVIVVTCVLTGLLWPWRKKK
jgi:phosphate/sulfate permease